MLKPPNSPMGYGSMTEAADRDAGGDPAVEPLMTLAEAAAALDRASESIRTMIRRGKLSARKGNDGRWLVAVPVEMRRQVGYPVNGSAAADPTVHGRAVTHSVTESDRSVDRVVELVVRR